jgi:hypothetical protein
MLMVCAITSPAWGQHVGKTSFLPSRHGFRFDNNFQTALALDIKTSGLCGGISYTSLDYYFANIPVPNQPFRPAVGTTLRQYLRDRQEKSILTNLDKWGELMFNPGGARDQEFFNWGLETEKGGRVEELRHYLDRGIPVPLGLKSSDGKGDHQVVAYGYKTTGVTNHTNLRAIGLEISIYDPNYPGNDNLRLIPDFKSQMYVTTLLNPKDPSKREHQARYRSYFVDRRYSKTPPPAKLEIMMPADGMYHGLVITCGTGNDDLRGGKQEVVNLTMNLKNGKQQEFLNINRGANWAANTTENAHVAVPAGVRKEDILSLVFWTTFSGGLSGDNWDLQSVTVSGLQRDKSGQINMEEITRQTKPNRFTGKNQPFTIYSNQQQVSSASLTTPATTPGPVTNPGAISTLHFQFTTGADDLRGGNDNLDILVVTKSGEQRQRNVNQGNSWKPNSRHHVDIKLNSPMPLESIREIKLMTSFQGGVGGDNWDLASCIITASTVENQKKTLGTLVLKRFTGKQPTQVFAIPKQQK